MWFKAAFAFACALACAIAHGTQYKDPVEDVLEQCDEFSQAAIRECLQRKVRGSLKALAQAEAKAAISIERWDEREQFIAKARDRLRASKHAFLKYRDTQCAFAASLGGGAIKAALEQRRMACIYALNTERTVALNRLASSVDAK